MIAIQKSNIIPSAIIRNDEQEHSKNKILSQMQTIAHQK
jgi:hypothetical protein